MTAAAPSKRLRPVHRLPSGRGLLAWFKPAFQTTVGAKFVVGLTGILLTGFVIGHLAGNLKIFAGRDAINSYAQWLKSLGGLLWVARFALLITFGLHIGFALWLKKRSVAARPVRYSYEDTVQASIASRTMVLTGLVILAYVLFHLAHFTFGWVKGATLPDGRTVNYLALVERYDPSNATLERHDVYNMMIAGFRNPVVSSLYLVAMFFLIVHLSHGIGSVFQTFGVNNPRSQPMISMMAWVVALGLGLANAFIVVAVWTGVLEYQF
jgi:succinate dehydrogenase / fumarate reductase, cytochrome b subunit